MMEPVWLLLCVLAKLAAMGLVLPVAWAAVCGVGQCVLSARCWHPADLVLPAGTGLAVRLVTYCGDHMPNALFDAAVCQTWVWGAFYGTMAGWVVGYLVKQSERENCRNV